MGGVVDLEADGSFPGDLSVGVLNFGGVEGAADVDDFSGDFGEVFGDVFAARLDLGVFFSVDFGPDFSGESGEVGFLFLNVFCVLWGQSVALAESFLLIFEGLNVFGDVFYGFVCEADVPAELLGFGVCGDPLFGEAVGADVFFHQFVLFDARGGILEGFDEGFQGCFVVVFWEF